MKLGYVVLYVPDVAEAVAFYESAFGLARRFVHESGDFAEMETGATALAFASEAIMESQGFPYRRTRPDADPPGVEVALVTDDVDGAYARATEAGAVPASPPVTKPWGQTVAYVRDPNGYLVEVCSPVEAPTSATPVP
ncbi:MAG: VOC family protein [Geminicoccaceae bacterium]|nr:VOC family protein [Geminicoccaceae bacterium]